MLPKTKPESEYHPPPIRPARSPLHPLQSIAVPHLAVKCETVSSTCTAIWFYTSIIITHSVPPTVWLVELQRIHRGWWRSLVNEWKGSDKRIFSSCFCTIGSSCYHPLVDVNERFGGFKRLLHSITSKPHALTPPSVSLKFTCPVWEESRKAEMFSCPLSRSHRLSPKNWQFW